MCKFKKLASCICVLLMFGTIRSVQAEQAKLLPNPSAPLLQKLVEQAKKEALQGYQAPNQIQNQALNDLSYDAYRSIRFDPKEALWHGERPFEVQLFHPGFLYKAPVRINVVDWQNRVNSLPFDSKKFIYDGSAKSLKDKIVEDVGYAGFRIHYPLNTEAYKDEFIVFQGATYFRIIGQDQIYGLSARALAINTGEPEGEEFPSFTDFWLIETESDAFTLYAKLDSPSATGIFKFVFKPGLNTRAKVEGWIFARKDIKKLGLAPFTSMFLYGENSLNKPDDFRPEVHDSDGVALQTQGRNRVWRPLDNPSRLRMTSLSANKPTGFGMLQRDIQYSHYVDPEANYHMRPGLWVEPKVGFNAGRLETVEIPTDSETHDNIVSYWVNNEPLLAGQSHYVKYSLMSTSGNHFDRSLAPVLRTMQGANRLPGEKIEEDDLSRRFVVDFQKPEGELNIDNLHLDLFASNARIESSNFYFTNFDSEIRVTFSVIPDQEDSVVDMRLALLDKEQVISEEWSYVYER